MNTPIQAAHEHLTAQMSQSVDGINKSTIFPFFHMQPDGETTIFHTAEEMAAFGGRSFKTEIIECNVVDSGEDSVVLNVVFQRYDLDGNKTIKAKAIWGTTRKSGSWSVHWRQFLGQVGSDD